MTKKCIGCGYELQTTDANKLGYIPKTANKTANLCERCFKIIHYNDAKVVTLPTDEKSIIDIVNKSKSHVLFLIDFLNINLKTIKLCQKIKRPKTLLISKSDIIPYSFNRNKIIAWLNDYYKIDDEIIFISALKNRNINTLLNYLEAKKITKAYLLGFTNVGKSSLVNSIVQFKELNHHAITTSLVPNTTLDFMNIKINDHLTIVDSPGFALKNNIYDNNDLSFIKKVNPKKFLKPITYQLKEGSSILIDDKIRIENLEKKNNFTFYLSNQIPLTRVFESKKLENLKVQEFDIPTNSDIVILGLGFINCKNACKVRIYINDLDLIEVRKSFF